MDQRVECPGCRSTLVVTGPTQERWVTCPRCLERAPNPTAEPVPAADLPGRFAVERGRRVDVQARGDGRVLWVTLAVLGAVCLGGIALMAIAYHNVSRSDEERVIGLGLFLAVLFMALDVVALVALGRLLAVGLARSAPDGGWAAKLFKGLVWCVLFLVAGLAVVVFFFVACMRIVET